MWQPVLHRTLFTHLLTTKRQISGVSCAMSSRRSFVTLGMFIIDEFSFADENGVPTDRALSPKIGGGGTYAAIGARIWLPSDQIGMVVDKGIDFPTDMEERLLAYGKEMWLFRERADRRVTTRALNSYKGDVRGFEYNTARIRITPKDLIGTGFALPKVVHFISSPTRASDIMAEVGNGWTPITVYEPIPDRCIPEELPALRKVTPLLSILSPNAEEAFSILSRPLPVTKEGIEHVARELLDFGVGDEGRGWVIIRGGPLGAYVKSRDTSGVWVDAYWTAADTDKVVDVTGAGNSFLGGLAAGLELTGGDVQEASLYASVSSSFVIEQPGLPTLCDGTWNGDQPSRRLAELRKRLGQ